VFSKKEIIKILKEYKIRPSRFLGQHFLVDKNVLNKIVESGDFSKKDIVLEVGAGIGNLTIEILKRVKEVIAVEKDKRFIEILKENLKGFKNLKIIEGDILKIKSFGLKKKNYKIVANLPYYLTSYFLRKFLESPPDDTFPSFMILMVQKEVAQRIVDLKKSNLLAISVRFYSEPKILFYVSKNCFYPKPKVDSALIKIIPRKTRGIKKELFFKLIKAGFSSPRKLLLRNLEKGLKLNKEDLEKIFLKNKINLRVRAEDVCFKNWILLANDLKNMVK
jgi:16S rRNA (adenine1518-N6/adenine1519-N6)-dimethyltransferase